MLARCAFAATILAILIPAGATAGTGWELIRLDKRSGQVAATVTFEARSDPTSHGDTDYRGVRLVMRQAGAVVLDHRYQGVVAAKPTLALRDVWGDSTAEALVGIFTGGNLCCVRLEVGLVAADGKGRALFHDFPAYGWHQQRYQGATELVSSDWGFICAFTSCADGSAPVQVTAIDAPGRRFIDVTRARPDLIEADAASKWRQYVRERGNVGLLAAWCADQYLLGSKSRCDSALGAELKAGRLDGSYGLAGKAFIAELHTSLAAWGYGPRR